MNEAKEAFLIAVENVITQCLIPVPSAPLSVLTEAGHGEFTDIAANSKTVDEYESLFDVWAAAQDVEWRFWPDDEYGSQQATVEMETVQRLSDALDIYRQEVIKSALLCEEETIPPAWESANNVPLFHEAR